MVTRLPMSPTAGFAPLRIFDPTRREETSRSLVGATLLVCAAFAGLGGMTRAGHGPGIVPDGTPEVSRLIDLLPPPRLEEPSGPAPRGGPAGPPREARFRPVEVAPTEPPLDRRSEGGDGAEQTGGATTGDAGARPGTIVDDVPPADRPSIYEVHDVEPEPRFAPAPEYPDLAWQAQVEGVVVLRALVDTDGRVREVVVERSVPLLDEAAVSAVRRWTFSPARSGEHPVRAWVLVPVRFRLHGGR